LAENSHLTYKYLTHYNHEFIDARITQTTSPEEVVQIAVTGRKIHENTRPMFDL